MPAWVVGAYRNDVLATYDTALRKANYEIAIAGFQAPGTTPEERAARVAGAIAQAAYDFMIALNHHFDFMSAHPPGTCMADAYAADVRLGNRYWDEAVALLRDPLGDADLASVNAARESFLGKLDGFLADC